MFVLMMYFLTYANPLYYTSDLLARGFTAAIFPAGEFDVVLMQIASTYNMNTIL